MKQGSGLVFESNSIQRFTGRNFAKVKTYKAKNSDMIQLTEGSVENNNMAQRKSLLKDELDVNSEISLM